MHGQPITEAEYNRQLDWLERKRREYQVKARQMTNKIGALKVEMRSRGYAWKPRDSKGRTK